MNIFVSNINYATKDHQLQELFEGYGEVSSAKIITDKRFWKIKKVLVL